MYTDIHVNSVFVQVVKIGRLNAKLFSIHCEQEKVKLE